jgi:hypothetical protein
MNTRADAAIEMPGLTKPFGQHPNPGRIRLDREHR